MRTKTARHVQRTRQTALTSTDTQTHTHTHTLHTHQRPVPNKLLAAAAVAAAASCRIQRLEQPFVGGTPDKVSSSSFRRDS